MRSLALAARVSNTLRPVTGSVLMGRRSSVTTQ
jgi:hypothetical protein